MNGRDKDAVDRVAQRTKEITSLLVGREGVELPPNFRALVHAILEEVRQMIADERPPDESGREVTER